MCKAGCRLCRNKGGRTWGGLAAVIAGRREDREASLQLAQGSVVLSVGSVRAGRGVEEDVRPQTWVWPAALTPCELVLLFGHFAAVYSKKLYYVLIHTGDLLHVIFAHAWLKVQYRHHITC